MPTVRYMSDLHFEFHADAGKAFVESLNTDADVLVLAGDIAVGAGIGPALDIFCKRFKNVVYAHGNHEFYGCSREKVVAITDAACERNENLHWLDGDAVIIGGVRFVGATLWFPKPTTEEGLAARRGMNDYFQIERFESWVYAEHAWNVAALTEHVRPGDVVVTHHLPTPYSIAPRFAGSPLNHFFMHDMTDLILERQPAAWIHGHTHDSISEVIGGTRILCNPMGYVGHEVNPYFNASATISVPTHVVGP